jgi:hypothetical protein
MAGAVATIVGTPRVDRLVGTKRRDVIVRRGGNDVLIAREELVARPEGAGTSRAPPARRVVTGALACPDRAWLSGIRKDSWCEARVDFPRRVHCGQSSGMDTSDPLLRVAGLLSQQRPQARSWEASEWVALVAVGVAGLSVIVTALVAWRTLVHQRREAEETRRQERFEGVYLDVISQLQRVEWWMGDEAAHDVQPARFPYDDAEQLQLFARVRTFGSTHVYQKYKKWWSVVSTASTGLGQRNAHQGGQEPRTQQAPHQDPGGGGRTADRPDPAGLARRQKAEAGCTCRIEACCTCGFGGGSAHGTGARAEAGYADGARG